MSSSQNYRVKCKENPDGSISLEDILSSFNNTPIREEHVWALCYQCTRFFIENLGNQAGSTFFLVNSVNQVFLQSNGNVHPNTIAKRPHETTRKLTSNPAEVIEGLGCVIYIVIDYSCDESEERIISDDLRSLIDDMVVQEESIHHETDDEGIERDSEDSYSNINQRQQTEIQLENIIERCEQHLANLSKQEVEAHYCAVLKAFVAEAIELASFLEIVAAGGLNHIENGDSTKDLEQLHFSDWTRLWVQVLAELRKGFTLKKVNLTRAPIEFELTPYEILMKDIRSCRFTLRKIMVNEDVPKVTKDARAIILEFIRSRPPLKKASDRKLPPRQYTFTPREQLMNSIRKGRKLRKITKPTSPPLKSRIQMMDTTSSTTTEKPRRLIKLDLSIFDDDYYDDESDSDGSSYQQDHVDAPNLDAYDLACKNSLQNPRRHSLGVYNLEVNVGSRSVPQSRPGSRQSCASSDNEGPPLAPKVAQALQDHSKPLEESVTLELTLDEIVQIRVVLTKAELEALPTEGHVRSDVENRKVCFLCLKTRFGILGPWGQRCGLCKRTVCSKCYCRMTIPMEHYSTIPVALLSPSILCTPEEEYKLLTRPSNGSARTSPQPSPCNSRPGSSLDRFRNKATAIGRAKSLKSSQMLVCHDCRLMVLRIMKSGQANRSAIRNKHLQNLTLDLDPVFPSNSKPNS